MRLLIAIVLIATAVVAWSKSPKSGTAAKQESRATSVQRADLTANGFSGTKEIRFDESMGTKKPTPRFPKNWRFIGVSTGSAPNANNLWFQDPSGTIYVLQGFTDRDGSFVMWPHVQLLRPD